MVCNLIRFASGKLPHMPRVALEAVILLLPLLHPALAQNHAAGEVLVYEHPSNQWFEAPSTRVTLSSNGAWALFSQWGRATGLISLPGGKDALERLSTGLDNLAEAATFCGEGDLARKGKRSSDTGWFLPREQGLQPASVPAGAVLRCSPDASLVAYYLPDQLDGGVYVGPIGKYEKYPAAGRVTGAAFSPDGGVLYALMFQLNGASTLLRITPRKHTTETVAAGLDAPPSECKFAVSPDGRGVFLPLAGDSPPNNAERHQPGAQRWLKIYRLDLATGTRRLVTESTGTDNSDPAVAAGYLYWHRTVIHEAIAVMPVGGGAAAELVAGGEFPMWSPDGSRISYVFGGWRLADWALNLDVGVIGVNGSQRTSSPKVFISGYHEDFPAA